MDKLLDDDVSQLFNETIKTLNQSHVAQPAAVTSMYEMRIEFTMKLLTVIATALIAAALALGSGTTTASEAPTNALKTRGGANAPIAVKLADDEQLAHRVVKGSLGPWKEATVVLTRPKGDDNIPFSGRVIVHQAKGEILNLPLPPPNEPVDFFYLIVESVMFRDIDRTGEKALIVLYLSHKIGSSEYGHRASVNRWNGSEFEQARTVEHLLFGAKTAIEVDRRLTKLKKDKK